jgi:3',5'-cyclic AMP phosphodiesterase CpdA
VIVVHVSDLHFGAQDETLAESLLVDVARQRPDLIVVSGDLTQRARRAEFRRAQGFLRQLSGPVLVVIGNHDVPLFDLPRRLVAPTKRYERYVRSERNSVVVLSDLVAVGLDSVNRWRWKSGRVSQQQANFVREQFASCPAGQWRLLVTHHPVLPTNLSALLGRGPVVEACAAVGVTVLLSGHTHVPSTDLVRLEAVGHHRQAVATVAGTATSRRTRGVANAYNVLVFAEPMAAGADAWIRVRQRAASEWVTVQTHRFFCSSDGIVAGDVSIA